MAQVDIQAGPFRVVSLMSREAVDELGLEVGAVAVAVIKSTTVVVEVPAAREGPLVTGSPAVAAVDRAARRLRQLGRRQRAGSARRRRAPGRRRRRVRRRSPCSPPRR